MKFVDDENLSTFYKKIYFVPHGEQSLLLLERKLCKLCIYGNYGSLLSDAELINTFHSVGKMQALFK